MARSIFVTGGSGLIGSALVRRLLERGDAVVALARSDDAAAKLRALGAEPVRGNLLDETSLTVAMAGCDLAFHVAGVNVLCPTDRPALFRANVEGVRLLMRAASRAGVRRVVHTSSAATLGEETGTVGREDSPHRGWYLSDYERSKTEGERVALAASTEHDLDVVCVNPSSVQGPGRAGGTGKILLALVDGRLKVFMDTHISLVDIDDTVEGHLLAAEKGVRGERYLLSGVTLTSSEALDLLERVGGMTERPRIVSGLTVSAAGALLQAGFGLVHKRPPLCREMARTLRHGHRYDGSRAERELGLTYTPAEDTLRRTVEWAAGEGLIRRHAAAA
ncbi:MAG: NAD-dependent epimerase/dehydratase family protein [Solirubrobacteraceae bacterium]